MKKQASLSTRIVITLILGSVMILALFAVGSQYYQRETLRQDIRQTAQVAVGRAATTLSTALWEYNDTYIYEYIGSLLQQPDVAFVRVRSEGDAYEKRAMAYALYGVDSFRDSSAFYWEEQPILHNGVSIGMIELAVSYASMNERLRVNVQQFVFMMAVLVLALAVITLFMFRRYIIKPIHALERVAAKVSMGDLGARSGITSNDEIGRLATSMDVMVEGLARVTASRDDLNQEIDRRILAETELKIERDRIKLYLDTVGVVLVALDRTGRISLLNRKGCELLGYNAREVEGRDWFETFIPAREREDVRAVFKGLMAGTVEPFARHENEIMTRDGSLRLFSWNNTMIRGGSGAILGTLGSGQDITDERRQEQALRQSEERFRVLVESMSEGVVALSRMGTLEYANQRFSEMLGIPHESLAGKRIEEFLDRENSERFRTHLDMDYGRCSEAHELVWTHADGHVVPTYVSPALIFSANGELEGATVAIADISKLKGLEGQLVQAQMLESLGSLAAGIAHEINTPCQYVLNNLQFLQKAMVIILGVLRLYEGLRSAEAQGQETLPLIEELARELERQQIDYLQQDVMSSIGESLEGIDRIAAIVRSVKQFANPGPEEKVSIDLNALVRNTVIVSTNEWKYLADLTMELDETLPLVPCVAGQLNQVLLNLIVNAAQAIGARVETQDYPKGEIRISTSHEPGRVFVEVTDNGGGIPQEVREHVFRPFFTTKAPGKGTGQGLAISQTVIRETHQGELTFETMEGQGTTFRIALPVGG
ncbi:MAG: PAS domain S-box protein [Proteobacteria bacterium]|nr:PAS domain S-box protein [Pseudomonadota bacterium]